MLHRPPNKIDANEDRLNRAFAAHSGQPLPQHEHEQAEDEIVAQIEQKLAELQQLIAQLKDGQAEVEAPADGQPSEDTGSPSAMGMP